MCQHRAKTVNEADLPFPLSAKREVAYAETKHEQMGECVVKRPMPKSKHK